MTVLRRKAPATTKVLPEQAPVRDDLVPVPRALLDRETRLAAYTLGLAEDQQAEVAMLMGTRPLDFRFRERCRQSTEVKTPPS